jgi:ferredoxin-NADP reductase
VDPADPEAGIHQTWRHFSLSSSASEQDFLEITVLSQGKASNRMHSLSPGDCVEVTRPEGKFVLEGPVGYGPVFFAGGIGIAPIRSMVRFCLEKGLGEAVSLFAIFSTPEEAIFIDELKAWADQTARVSVWVTYSADESTRHGRIMRSGLWNRGFLEERIERPLARVYYLCTPPGLMDKVEAHLASIGVPPEKVRKERW